MRKSVIVLMSVLLLVTACGRKKACNEPVNKDFGVQLYSIRSVIGDSALYAANHEEAFKALAEMGYSYVEAACYNDGKLYGVDPAQYKADLEAAGLKSLSTHVGHALSPEELKTAIEYVADGLEYYGRDIAKILRDFSNARKGLKTEFTKREGEILELCAQGLSAKDISRRLDISINTVNSHKDNIFKKLGINSSLELVRWSIDHGIISI